MSTYQGPGVRQKNIGLILLSLAFLPVDTFFTICALVSCYISQPLATRRRNQARQKFDFSPKTILVTGVGMTKGLVIARSFYEAGHNVVGADFEPSGALACGRFSRSISEFLPLRPPKAGSGAGPYIESLLSIIKSEGVDLWVSCSGVASALEDGEAKEIIEARTSCKAIQFDMRTTQTLHEKHSFMQHTKDIGLTVPDTHYIASREAVDDALKKAPEGRKYIMKPVGMDDANRGDMTLLPRPSTVETAAHLSKLRISEKSSWILQQYISGPEYCTHSLVVKGQVKAFVACPSAELLMHYEALPSDSKLHRAMLDFTLQYARNGGESFTGHLSFDFMIDQNQMDGPHSVREGMTPTLYPIECNPRAHTAVVLFNETQGMPSAYLSVLDAPPADWTGIDIVTPHSSDKYFWIGHDLVELLLLPLVSLLLMQPAASLSDLASGFSTFVNHVLYWRDGTFERWDPLPWWCLYHIYWPMRFLQSFNSGKGWSRINVSTTKMFEC
ncbi:uncharacterized protein LTR77_005067 [Saxophila tyrrhenica]|uniref:ATP-grasp domain-containing protein n=1 Tax=Saxophila tyrrhenica TaxID=1690608 RepID=A0AAV9PDC4_9PEZI|nr:hypothetical protein LTR77_005067 [Saxophila tyrrhenica]